jgi:zinc protease
VDWPTKTLPLITVVWRGPAYADDNEDSAALDAIAELGFGRTSPLYQKLVVDEQKVDRIGGHSPDNLDPELFSVQGRVKNAADLPSIEQQIIATAKQFGTVPVDAKKLEALKQHLRYEFALSLNNAEAIAGAVADFVALRRTPETINRYFDTYAKLTPEDIQKAARRYLIDNNRTVVTLTGPEGGK